MRKFLLVLISFFLALTLFKSARAANTSLPDTIGVFGLPDDNAATDLGVTWTRLALTEWKKYLANPNELASKLNKLKNTKVIATLRSVSSKEMVSCGQDPEALVAKYNIADKIPAGKTVYDIFSCPPKDYLSTSPGSYADFLTKIVTTSNGKVDAWQIENEVYGPINRFWLGDAPGEFDNFIKHFKFTSDFIRKLDPNTPILAAGITIGNNEFNSSGVALSTGTNQSKGMQIIDKNVRQLFSQACSSFDVVDIHLYHTVESIQNRITWLKKVMSETKCIKPIWSTEISGPDPFGKQTLTDAQFVQQQASELGLRLQTAQSSGIEKTIYFLYQQVPGSTDQGVAKLGLVDGNSNKKPAYAAMQEFAQGQNATTAKQKNGNSNSMVNKTKFPMRKLVVYGGVLATLLFFIGVVVIIRRKIQKPPSPPHQS